MEMSDNETIKQEEAQPEPDPEQGAERTDDTSAAPPQNQTAVRGLAPKKRRVLYNFVVVPLVMIVSGLIRAVVVHMFVSPYNFASSGVSGIGVMIQHLVPWFSAGYTYIILNAPLLVLSWLFINKRFTVISGISIMISALGMILMNEFDAYLPTYGEASDLNPLFAAIAAGVLGGVGFAMMIAIGGSTGGSDIIAMLIQKRYPATNISWFVYAVDAMIIFASIFVYRGDTSMAFINPVMLSLTEEFSHALVGDTILTGFKTALKYEIITDDPESISNAVMTKLGRGVTCMDVTGMYSHSKRYMLICVIRKNQLAEFNKILQAHPNTFAYVLNTREVIGRGFGDKKIREDKESGK